MNSRMTMTVAEAALALGVGRGTAYEMARDGRLPVLKIGRRLLVPRVALERLVEGGLSDQSTELLARSGSYSEA